MMTEVRTVSVIDDAIPAIAETWLDATRPLCHNCLKALVDKKDEWDDPDLHALVNSLVEDADSWHVTGFTNPRIFLNAREEDGYRPDLVVYDWDYGGSADDPLSLLHEIVEGSHALVAVYSRSDQSESIDQALASELLSPFSSRIERFEKTEGSETHLRARLNDHYERNFSGRFSRDMRRAAGQALESVLVEMGKHELDAVLDGLGAEDAALVRECAVQRTAHSVSTLFNTLGASVAGRLRQLLEAASELFRLPVRSEGEAAEAATSVTMEKLWQYALYYAPADSRVRRGDLVQNGDLLYLVINRTCDLAHFWGNGLGSLLLVPLQTWSGSASDLSSRLLRYKKRVSLRGIRPSSLTNPGDSIPGGCFLLPFVLNLPHNPLLVGSAKEITSVRIDLPAELGGETDGKRVSARELLYSDCREYGRICSLTEPFGGELALYCIASLMGTGVTDYPPALSQTIQAAFGKGLPDGG